VAAAGILFFMPSEKGRGDSSYQDYMKHKALRFAFVFTVIQGILGLLVLLTTVNGARSEDVVGPESLSLLLILALMIMYYRSDLGFEMPVFSALILILAMNSFAFEINSETAIRNHTKLLVSRAREIEKARGIFVPEAVPEGKAIFRNACASCHGYEKRLTGPPMKDILPKYDGKAAELEAFINNPRRINPYYPPMPKPAILGDEKKAVSQYLLGDYLKENQGKR
jgi:cytochrome c551/c552